jgi:DNA polymerase I-like protein with 3'-5' exonuclease and polymerase domains
MALISLDFESFYSKDFTLSKLTTEEYIRSPYYQTIGFAYTIDGGEPEWVTGSDEYIAKRLRELNLHEHKLLAHNAVFDAAVLAWRYNIHPKFIFDTLSMARPIIDITKGGSLKNLAEKFMLGEKGTEIINALGKRREDFTPDELDRYGEYCKNDVVLCRNLFYILSTHSTPQEMYIIDMLIRMYTDPVIHLDRDVLTAHLNNVQARKAELMSKIDQSIGRDALMSNPQFADVLRGLGVEPPTKISAKTGKEAFAFAKTDTAFTALLEHEDDRVQTLVAARLGVKSTLEETRTESFLALNMRGPLPIMLNYYGAHTGRASGGDKLNLQNLPRGGQLRASMKAPFGHSMVACDSSQIEARVTAWWAGQNDLVAEFAAGEDVYSNFGTSLYHRPINKKDTPKERHVAKTAILGLGFGCGAKKFVNMACAAGVKDIDEAEAVRIVRVYRDKYPMIVKLWKDAEAAIKAMASGNEYMLGVGMQLKCDSDGIHLPNGMIQRYPNLRYMRADGEKFKQDGYYYDSRYGPNYIYGPKLVENVVQALARIVVFTQMAKINQNMKKYDRVKGFAKRFKVTHTVHDEVVVVCPDEYTQQVKTMMVRIMSTPPSWGPGLPIACEAEHGKSYAECK